MGRADLVKITVFVTDPRFVEEFRAARDKVLGAEPPVASTLLVVDGLAAPDILVEIEATAARVPG